MAPRETLVLVDADEVEIGNVYEMTVRGHFHANGLFEWAPPGREHWQGVNIDILRASGATWQRVDPDPELPEKVGAVIVCELLDHPGKQVAGREAFDSWRKIGSAEFFADDEITRVHQVLHPGGDL